MGLLVYMLIGLEVWIIVASLLGLVATFSGYDSDEPSPEERAAEKERAEQEAREEVKKIYGDKYDKYFKDEYFIID